MGQRVVVMSPTFGANPVFSSLKHLSEADVITDYSDETLVDLLEDIKKEHEATQEYKMQQQIFEKFLKSRDIDKMTEEELIHLELMDYREPEPPRYPNGAVTFLVLDDLIGSSAFRATGKSELTNLVLRNRHLGVNILIATQSLKSIPKAIRLNASLFVLYRFANRDVVLEDLYEEVSGLVTKEQFAALYSHATQEDHDALVIDQSQPKLDRIRKNFDVALSL